LPAFAYFRAFINFYKELSKINSENNSGVSAQYQRDISGVKQQTVSDNGGRTGARSLREAGSSYPVCSFCQVNLHWRKTPRRFTAFDR
jgi:hypothetical protein